MTHAIENQDTRVEIESSRYEKGRLLVTVKGLAGERFEDIPWEEPFGFHSRPAKGATGFITAPGGRRDQAVVRAAHDPDMVPQIEEGEAVLYDQSKQNLIKVTAAGMVLTHGTSITINGPVTLNGDLQVSGNVNAGGSVIDVTGNTNHHTH